jgi:hypothetical protein
MNVVIQKTKCTCRELLYPTTFGIDAKTAVKQSVIAKTAKNIVTGERFLR